LYERIGLDEMIILCWMTGLLFMLKNSVPLYCCEAFTVQKRTLHSYPTISKQDTLLYWSPTVCERNRVLRRRIMKDTKDCYLCLTEKNYDMEEQQQEDLDVNDFVVVDTDEYRNMMEQARIHAPDTWTIARQLLGINIFTYILGGFILFFLFMNTILGPGWLGQQMGFQGTGSLPDTVSDHLPLSIDLSQSKYFIF